MKFNACIHEKTRSEICLLLHALSQLSLYNFKIHIYIYRTNRSGEQYSNGFQKTGIHFKQDSVINKVIILGKDL